MDITGKLGGMKVRIKRIDESLPLPRYETEGAVGFDFIAREEVKIAAKSIALVPGNVIVEVPYGYTLVVALRSSTPRKKGLLMPHGVGIIDSDYCGTNDEVKIQVYNFLDHEVVVSRGDRIAQGIFMKSEKAEWEEMSEAKQESRGGFGSTDK